MSDYLEDRKKAEADCLNHAKTFVEKVQKDSNTTKVNFDVSIIPRAIAEIFDLLSHQEEDPRSFYFENAIQDYAGLKLSRCAPIIEAFGNQLKEAGAISLETRVDVGSCDRYAYYLCGPQWRQGLVLQTQSRDFLFLMRWGSSAKQSQADYDNWDEPVCSNIYAPQVFVCHCTSANAPVYAFREHGASTQPSWTQEFALFCRDQSIRGALPHISELSYAIGNLLSTQLTFTEELADD